MLFWKEFPQLTSEHHITQILLDCVACLSWPRFQSWKNRFGRSAESPCGVFLPQLHGSTHNAWRALGACFIVEVTRSSEYATMHPLSVTDSLSDDWLSPSVTASREASCTVISTIQNYPQVTKSSICCYKNDDLLFSTSTYVVTDY